MTTFCRTAINYFPTADRPGAAAREVEVRDGRTAELPGWSVAGFELVEHRSAIGDWTDDEQVRTVHYAEVEALAREMTGADVALVSAHIRRGPEQAKQHQQLSPITFVHSDFAAGHADIIRGSYGPGRPGAGAALERNGVDADAVVQARRLVILQFWRNLGPGKMDFPLAFCDARTVDLADGRPFHVTNYAGTGANFDALGIAAPQESADHAWYVFPEMASDEAVAFRTYDTDLVRDGEVYFTPHSAVRDPEVPVGQPARTSIELRATCLFR